MRDSPRYLNPKRKCVLESPGHTLEEYKILRGEIEYQQKQGSQTFTLTIILTLTFLGYGFSGKNTGFDKSYYLLPVFLPLLGYANLMYSRFLGQKTDAYIQVFIEPLCPGLNWFHRKVGFYPDKKWLEEVIAFPMRNFSELFTFGLIVICFVFSYDPVGFWIWLSLLILVFAIFISLYLGGKAISFDQRIEEWESYKEREAKYYR
ncbi:hypothetical protein IIA28_13875 [candidate division KSB1 bacterium]|nr:hypothetical protein [candidate division KSB1 bacterium]